MPLLNKEYSHLHELLLMLLEIKFDPLDRAIPVNKDTSHEEWICTYKKPVKLEKELPWHPSTS